MPLKPIRFGYKVWCLNLNGGYLYNFQVYQGKGSSNEFTGLYGLGPGVVLGLLKDVPKGNYCVYIDNYFVSIPLLKYLSGKEIGCTGTLKVNMMQDCPISDKSFLKQQPKGHLQSYVDKNSDVVICRWNDNAPVTVGSNFESVFPLDTARRWDRTKKVYINVPRPALIASYNNNMGGTDQMGQSLSTYRPRIRNRKWCWPLFLYMVHTSCYNS